MFRASLCPSSARVLTPHNRSQHIQANTCIHTVPSARVLAPHNRSQHIQANTCIHTVRSARVPTPHNRSQHIQANTCIHTVPSARVLTPHNRSQHIQANITRGFIQSVLLTMGVMMPETCWVNLLWINFYTCLMWFWPRIVVNMWK